MGEFDLCPDATHDCGYAYIEVQCAVEVWLRSNLWEGRSEVSPIELTAFNDQGSWRAMDTFETLGLEYDLTRPINKKNCTTNAGEASH